MTAGEGERPVTTAEKVVDAIRVGADTVDRIVAHTGINASAVGIALTNLTANKVVVRRRAGYSGRPGARSFVYQLTPPSPSEPVGPSSPVAALGLSTRIVGLLHGAEIVTVADLTARTAGDLRAIPGMGRRSVAEIVAQVDTAGHALRQTPDRDDQSAWRDWILNR